MKEIKDAQHSVLVVVVTAKDGEEVAVEAFRPGSRELLAKSFRTLLPSGPETPDDPARTSSPVTLSQYHKIQQALRFINDHYETGIRLGDAAAKAGMSQAHFSRLFKKVIGLSYLEYLNGRRITKAKSLLRTGARSVAEIALSLGYADSTGFCRNFKKLTGQTPTAYRHRQR